MILKRFHDLKNHYFCTRKYNLMNFKLTSAYTPTGDQPEAISSLVRSIKDDNSRHVTLLGVTGSGKTFTMANVINELNRPTLVLSHNKTLAGQLYNEFKSFFPENAVEFFVSYYDYYQPEAYLPQSDTYIEKDLAINEEIEKLRLSTASTLLSGRRDVVVVSSVSCLYGIGNPSDFHENTINVKVGELFGRQRFLQKMTTALYSRDELDFKPGTFKVKGDTIDIHPAYSDTIYRVVFNGERVEGIFITDSRTSIRKEALETLTLYPASNFVTSPERLHNAIEEIQDDLYDRVEYFNSIGKSIEAGRLKSRVEYDLEMIKEVGYCSGIENYSRYFDGRSAGSRPFCLLDYFPDDYLMIIDESHVTVPQIRAMYGGDYARKVNLVDYGFRLPSAMDNRPLKFDEFERLQGQTVYASATPADFELAKSEGVVVEQIIRPTGLLEPVIEVKPTENQIDDILVQIREAESYGDSILITTLTKRMAEELTKYLTRMDVKCRYIHSDVTTIDRLKLLDEFRDGVFNVLIGVNLLREGLDLPQVALVIIMDADKEGFLRSHRSLTQTVGRAARNLHGRVIMYADTVTDSMRVTIDETLRRRDIQKRYNEEHGITPKQIKGAVSKALFPDSKAKESNDGIVEYDLSYNLPQKHAQAAEHTASYSATAPMTSQQLHEEIEKYKNLMTEAAKKLDFAKAAEYRDKMYEFQNKL